eukprot:365363-Chlamydomonas_euryale.AAC.5
MKPSNIRWKYLKHACTLAAYGGRRCTGTGGAAAVAAAGVARTWVEKAVGPAARFLPTIPKLLELPLGFAAALLFGWPCRCVTSCLILLLRGFPLISPLLHDLPIGFATA